MAGAGVVCDVPKAPVPAPKLNMGLSEAAVVGADAAAPPPKILVPAGAAPNGDAAD